MKRKFSFIATVFLASLICNISNAQTYDNLISGYVKDASTGKALVGVNVYLSGTYWGSTTDDDGYYLIKSIVPGNYEIVASMVGYEPKYELVVVKESMETKIDFFITEKVYKLNDVTIQAEPPEEWYDQLDLFKKHFLGKRYFADDCVIENEVEINFFETESTLLAMCDNPLSIDNIDLGYHLDCLLLDFLYDKNTGGCTFIVKSRFTELTSDDPDVLADWEYNREEAYFGSLRHFLVTLVNDEFIGSDFLFIWKIRKAYTRTNSLRYYSSPEIYYYSDSDAEELLDTTLVYNSQKNEYQFTLDKPLLIDYKGWISTFHLTEGKVTLDQFGYPKQILAINVLGDWGRYGVADFLPQHYERKFQIESTEK